MPCFDILGPELQGTTFHTLISCLAYMHDYCTMSHAMEHAYPVTMHILMMLTGDCLPGIACVTSVSEMLTNALALGIATPFCWPDVCDCESVLGARPPDVTCRNNNHVYTLHGCLMVQG